MTGPASHYGRDAPHALSRTGNAAGPAAFIEGMRDRLRKRSLPWAAAGAYLAAIALLSSDFPGALGVYAYVVVLSGMIGVAIVYFRDIA
jgi:hypothetical protein